MGTGGLSSYFKLALRKCGLIFLSESSASIYMEADAPDFSCIYISSHSQTHQLCTFQHFNIYLNIPVTVLGLKSFFLCMEGGL